MKGCKHCGNEIVLPDVRVELVHKKSGLYRCPDGRKTVAE